MGVDKPSGDIFSKAKRLAGRKDIDIWFEDECHFQQRGSGCTMWVPPEDIDPVILHAPTKKYNTGVALGSYAMLERAKSRLRELLGWGDHRSLLD